MPRRLSPPCARVVRASSAAAVASLSTILAQPTFAATFVFSNPLGGDLNVSTNYSPAGIPSSADTLRVAALPTIPGFLTLNVAVNQSIGRIELDHFAPTTITNSGSATLTLTTGQLAFTDAVTEAPDGPLDTLLLYAPIAGGNGLTKTGPGFAFLNGNNLYTGGTTISGPGGVSVTKDAALGDAGGGVTLTGNGTLRVYNSFATSRAITVGAGGGRLESYGNLTLNGAIGGAGTLTVGRFTGGTVTLNASNTLQGGLVIAQSNTVNLLGQLPSISSLTLGGTLNLGLGTTAPSFAAVNDAAPINSLGGTLNVAASSASSIENLGTLTLGSGTTNINLSSSAAAGTQIGFAGLARQNRSTAFIRGRNLGVGSLAPARTLVSVGDVTNLPLVGGGAASGTSVSIIPFVFANGNPNANIDTVPRNAEYTGFVTRGINGLRALDASNYATNPLTAAATDNVRVSDTLFTLDASKTINSLIVRETQGFGGQFGLTGAGTLTVTSGAILAVSNLAGTDLVIDNPIAFGAAEGVVHTATTDDLLAPGYSQLTLNGAISGTNGLTKSGSGDLYLNGQSSYSGVTTINAGSVVVTGNVLANSNSALGNSATDIVINAGVTDGQYVGLYSSTSGATITRNIFVRQNANANSLAILGTTGSNSANFAGQVAVEAGFLNLLGSVSPDALTISGSIVGAGGIQEPADASPPRIVRLSGDNTYAGGTQIRSGRWQVGSDTAFGSGTLYFVGNGVATDEQTGTVEAFGGPRSIANPVVFRATPVIAGGDAFSFTGSIDLGGVARTVKITNTADSTFAGVVGRGGIVKTGGGRLILSNANTYNGQTLINEGILRITNGGALGVANGPAGETQATFINGSASLELAGTINTGESIFLGSQTPITTGLSAGNLRSVSGSNTITGQVAFDDVGTIGVDAGSTLSITGDGVDNTSTGTAALRKVGTGQLNVKNVRLPTLSISAGTVRVAAGSFGQGTSRVSSLSIAGGASLDLNNNALVYDYAASSPIQAVRQALADGRITTTLATAGAAVGYAEASSILAAGTFPNSFAGQSVDSTTLLLIQTLRGDANLDRSVAFDDLVALAQNYNTSGKVWREGDFTYDGAVNFDDLVALAQNYNRTAAGSITAADFGAAFASDWALAQSLVPEPGALSVLVLGAIGLRKRRDRPSSGSPA